MAHTVKIEYPDGTTREVVPAAWEVREGCPPRPIFYSSPWDVAETVDGRYFAVRKQEEAGQ